MTAMSWVPVSVRRSGVWPLTAALVAGAAALYLLVLGLPTPPHPQATLWFVPAFALAEVFVVHIEIRRNAVTFSLVELPLVVGLFHAEPALLVPAHLAGAALALAGYRRQPPVKLTFNLAVFAFVDCCALLLFHASVGAVEVLSPRTWAAAFAATALASVLGTLAVQAAIRMSGGAQSRDDVERDLLFGVTTALATTSTALALVVLARTDWRATALLALPIAATYAAHHAFVAWQRDKRTLRFLESSTGLVHRSPEATTAVRDLLRSACEEFQSDIAALTFAPLDDPAAATLIVVGPDDADPRVVSMRRHELWPVWERAARDGKARYVSQARQDLTGLVPDASLRDGVIVAARLGERVVGYLLVANRQSDVSSYSAADLLALSTLANDLAVGLEDGQLDQIGHQLRILERQLAHRARHDQVTGLSDELAFLEGLASRLDSDEDVAVVVAEISGVDPAAMDDGLSLVVAGRLRHCLRADDLVARLDAFTFAALGSVSSPVGGDLLRDRLQSCLEQRIVLDGAVVPVLVHTGVALGGNYDDARLLVSFARP